MSADARPERRVIDPDTIPGVISHTDVLGAYERFVLGQVVAGPGPSSGSGP